MDIESSGVGGGQMLGGQASPHLRHLPGNLEKNHQVIKSVSPPCSQVSRMQKQLASGGVEDILKQNCSFTEYV